MHLLALTKLSETNKLEPIYGKMSLKVPNWHRLWFFKKAINALQDFYQMTMNTIVCPGTLHCKNEKLMTLYFSEWHLWKWIFLIRLHKYRLCCTHISFRWLHLETTSSARHCLCLTTCHLVMFIEIWHELLFDWKSILLCKNPRSLCTFIDCF